MSYGPSYYVVIIIKAINYICRRREEEEKMVTGRCMYVENIQKVMTFTWCALLYVVASNFDWR